MTLKKITLISLATISIFSSTLYAEEALPKDKPGTAVFVMSSQKGEILVNTDYIEEEKDYLSIHMNIPVMSNFKSKRFQRKLNKTIKQNQSCLKQVIEKDAARNYQYTKQKAYPTHPYELLTNYHVKSNAEIFSLEITVYDYRGGAHGMTTNTYYNVDTNTCKLLSLKDYLVKCSGDKNRWYQDRLNEEIQRQITQRENQGEVFFEGHLGFQGVKENQAFYITPEGQLVIVFGLYEIAPYASGIIEFPIPSQVIQC